MTTQDLPSPSWQPDPTGRFDHRWWDGTAWTSQVASQGKAYDESTPPPPRAGRPSERTLDPIAPTMSFAEAVRTVLVEKYADFTGRASRAEYWWWMLYQALLGLLGSILAAFFAAFGPGAEEVALVALLMVFAGLLIPSIAVTARRLHDSDKPGWLMLIGLVPVGGLAILVLVTLPSDPHENRYGLPPTVAPRGT